MRQITLSSQEAARAGMALLEHVPIDAEHPLEMLIRPLVEKRSNVQNALYWKRLGEIEDQAWLFGRSYSAETWHEHCRQEVMPDVVEIKNGDLASKWIELPNGTRYVRSTTELSKKCFADYITLVERFGASLGVMFSADPRLQGPRR